jgi:hypothetical protein
MQYLCSFKPLIITSAGRRLAKSGSFPPFIDGSIRREPDLESAYPSISALCRGRNFAPRLREGDAVAYISVKGTYDGQVPSHWRLVAILDVIQRFETHTQAAEWYRAHGFPIPSNCVVPHNPPKHPAVSAWPRKPQRGWEARYRARSIQFGDLLACTSRFIDLSDPPPITEADMVRIFGRIPGTHNPPAITTAQMNGLQNLRSLKGAA